MNKKYILAVTLPLILVLTLAMISAVSVRDVSTSPAEVIQGKDFSVSVEIENIFEYDIENLQVKLDLTSVPFAPYQSSSEKFLDELDSDNKEDFSFKLIPLPDASSGIYKLPVQINYEYEENNKTETGSKTELISIIVNSKPELAVSLEDSVVLIRGKENKISIEVVNSGLSDAKFLYIKTQDTSGMNLLSQKSQYIGDIDSDDFDSVDYNVYISPTASSSIELPVTLNFMDSTNNVFEQNSTIFLKTYSLEEAQKLGLVKKSNYAIYIGLISIVLLYVIYRIIKKKKKRM